MLPKQSPRYDHEPEARRHLDQARAVFDDKSLFLVRYCAPISLLVCAFVCLSLCLFFDCCLHDHGTRAFMFVNLPCLSVHQLNAGVIMCGSGGVVDPDTASFLRDVQFS